MDAALDLYNGYYSRGKTLDPYNYNGERLYFGKKNSSYVKPLIQLLNKSQNTASPTPYFIASDHNEDIPYYEEGSSGNVHLSEALFYEGDSIGASHFADLRINGEPLGCDIKASELTSSHAKIRFDFK